MINRFEAIKNLVGGGIGGRADGTEINYHGKTPPSEAEIDDKLAELQAEYDAQEYARNREKAYDSVGDQLDMLMKDMRDGTTTHKVSCEAVKAKYPKPE
tara:strand:- start:280 stop:576 length:297 start_codon:yes stop_codon:yes gene_type:complete